MVKNRNWETRTEIAEARRLATRQRKQKRDNKSVYKAMAYDLLAMMDRHSDALKRRNSVLHIWTDTPHSDGPSLQEIISQENDDEHNKRSNHRRRSLSFNETTPKNRNKGRTRRSNSFSDSGKKKGRKGSNSNDDQEYVAPRLCRNHFFNGKCEDFQRKGGSCQQVHLGSDRFKTLCSVLKGDDSSQILSMSREAASADASVSESPGPEDAADSGMEMLCCFSLSLYSTQPDNNCDTEEEVTRSASDTVSKALSEKSCSLGSIVYVTVDNTLVFDRYRDGLIMSDNGFAMNVLGETTSRRSRSSSVESQGHQTSDLGTDEDDVTILLHGSLLEYILTFLPDMSVPVMCMVCQAWNEEIGTTSPALWKHLLHRRGWPLPSAAGEDVGTSEGLSARDVFRDQFLMHYSVMRNIHAIQTATCALTASSGKPVANEKECVVQSFSTRRGAPQNPNGCVDVRIWSPQRIVAAYGQDCTLRLFEAASKPMGDSSSNLLSCREVVCVRVAPYKNNRRRRFQLVAIDLDEDMVGCLCFTMADDKDVFYLTVIGREDFLCAGGNSNDGSLGLEDGTLHVICIGEAVLNYLLSSDEVDHGLLRLSDFVRESGVSNVEVLPSQSVVACGYGRFMVEVTISIPSNEFGDEEMVTLDRKLVLFSASAGAILWMGSSDPTQSFLLSFEDMQLSCILRPHTSWGSLTECNVAAASSTSSLVLHLEIDPTGDVRFAQPMEASKRVRNALTVDGWEVSYVMKRPVVVTPSDIVVAENLCRRTPRRRVERKTVVSFYPRVCGGSDSYSLLTLQGVCSVARMKPFGDQHVVLFCHVAGGDEGATEPVEQFDEQASVYALVIHVPTRLELERTRLLKNLGSHHAPTYDHDIPFFFAASGDTVGVGIWWKGVVLTGSNVRSLCDCDKPAESGSDAAARRKKKKKKRQAMWGSNKQDAYSRGTSMSG